MILLQAYSFPHVEEVDCALLINIKVFRAHRDIHFTPVDSLLYVSQIKKNRQIFSRLNLLSLTYVLGFSIKNDSLIFRYTTSLASRAALKSSSFCDARGSNSGIRGIHVLRHHGKLVKFSNSVLN